MLRSSLAVFALLVSLAAASANASQRPYVSAISGDDANIASGCVVTAPRRWFTRAISAVDPGGELVVLHSGAYGTVTITKSISIISAPGAYAGISVFSGDGITIATAGVDVVLCGLAINNLGSSGSGIHMTAGKSLVVQNCVITNFTSSFDASGVNVEGTTEVRLLDSPLKGNVCGTRFSNGLSVLVSNSRFIDNTRVLYGRAYGAGVETKAEASRSEASGNSNNGFFADAHFGARVELNVKDSVASRNASGVCAASSSGATLVGVTGSLISGNTKGLWASTNGARLVASGNTVTHNILGLYQSYSAVLGSVVDNLVPDNITATYGTITTISKSALGLAVSE